MERKEIHHHQEFILNVFVYDEVKHGPGESCSLCHSTLKQLRGQMDMILIMMLPGLLEYLFQRGQT